VDDERILAQHLRNIFLTAQTRAAAESESPAAQSAAGQFCLPERADVEVIP